jgi:CrcB protein
VTVLAYVALGGLVGTVSRYLLQGWVQAKTGMTTFPIGTLVINVGGSLALGFVIRYATGSTVVSPELRAGLTIGFCGAFTTMSTFGYETMTLLGDGELWQAAWYMGGTVLGCVAAVIVGTALANRLL